MSRYPTEQDIQKLEPLLRRNRSARIFFHILASYKRNKWIITVDSFVAKLAPKDSSIKLIVRRQLIAIMKELQELGYGRFIKGSHGRQSRFVFHKHWKSIEIAKMIPPKRRRISR